MKKKTPLLDKQMNLPYAQDDSILISVSLT